MAFDDVHSLRIAKRPGPSAELLAILDDVRARAERGEIEAIAIAADLVSGETLCSQHLEVGGSIGGLVLALEQTKLRLLRHSLE